jgi:hypothetical protein
MACLVLRIEDRNPGRPGAYTAGDVVCVLPDDHVFSPAEVSGGVLRVIKLPGISEASLNAYLFANDSTRRSQGFDLSGALGELLRRATAPITLTRAMAWEVFNLTRERPGL